LFRIALCGLGDIELKRGNREQTLPLLQKAVQSRTDMRIAYLDIGTILAEQKRYPEAIAALQRAVELDPNQPDAHYWLGRVYQGANNATAAKREFAKVRALHQKAEDDVASQMSRLSKIKPQ
jgi:tetratricopeptide (TPR) repeat protein